MVDLREALARVVYADALPDNPDTLIDQVFAVLREHGREGWLRPNVDPIQFHDQESKPRAYGFYKHVLVLSLPDEATP